ncbi:hypothetical protein XAB3213_2730002 [Xanthomonas citri pv. bilvae]|nr:hypothetical protein XAB3213_2730002 [Xanthomonas citri pv. bilvae]
MRYATYLLGAVEALVHGGRLTLIDIARAWPGATRVRAPLKACDRLLCNRTLQAERSMIERDMAHWLLRGDGFNPRFHGHLQEGRSRP